MGDQGVLVTSIFENATEKMIAAKNNIGAADAYRVQAGLYAPYGSLGPNMPKSCEFLRKAINLLLPGEPIRTQPGAMAEAMDWVNYELSGGNWPCGEMLGKWLIVQYQFANPNYAKSLESQLSQVALYRKSVTAPWPFANPSGDSCPKDIFHGLRLDGLGSWQSSKLINRSMRLSSRRKSRRSAMKRPDTGGLGCSISSSTIFGNRFGAC